MGPVQVLLFIKCSTCVEPGPYIPDHPHQGPPALPARGLHAGVNVVQRSVGAWGGSLLRAVTKD